MTRLKEPTTLGARRKWAAERPGFCLWAEPFGCGSPSLAHYWHTFRHPMRQSRCSQFERSSFVFRWLGWSHPPGLNRRPADYESAALPTELGWLGSDFSRRLPGRRRSVARHPKNNLKLAHAEGQGRGLL